MNYGFASPEMELKLDPADEPDRMCIQLYERVIKPASLKGQSVLEVGAGRGGGASYIARKHLPRKYTAVDYSPQAVAYCQKRHTVPNLVFQSGDAEALPFADRSFDAVLNVESSHCYGSVATFFKEVSRVLRPGGHFLFADLREPAEMSKLALLLDAQKEMELIDHEDISANVHASLMADEARKRAQINELIPANQRGLFDEFAGLAGSKIMRGLADGSIVYHRFGLKKK